MNERQRIGERLQQVMDEKGITSEYLAAQMDFRIKTIENLIAGKFQISMDVWCEIAKILDCRIDFVNN